MADPIGELLIRERLISAAQLVQAKINQKQSGGKLEDSLVSLGFLTPEQIKKILHPVPPIPLKIISTGLSEAFLSDLLLKAVYQEAGTFTLRQIIKKLCLPFSVIDELIELLKADQLIAIRSATSYGRENVNIFVSIRIRTFCEIDNSRFFASDMLIRSKLLQGRQSINFVNTQQIEQIEQIEHTIYQFSLSESEYAITRNNFNK
ncbi:hypothetical protein [Nitrosomonas supralitoralis]|uniref:Uncharacterized protein n=1 Tax=Nitrosomonas supralitoralis TaxID=2116706 RepID=A0A2P7NV89_9PROT|nr:hypothetical protein [Nitrosomonas supralitoralis]PSJ17358.1 hypothetical protein C7H79_08685 [Nitrosomonas supralitoralis]